MRGRGYPTKYHRIVKEARKSSVRLEPKMTSQSVANLAAIWGGDIEKARAIAEVKEEVRVTQGQNALFLLPDARLILSPSNLASRIMDSAPDAVLPNMVRLSSPNIFIEFEASSFLESSAGKGMRVEGVHLHEYLSKERCPPYHQPGDICASWFYTKKGSPGWFIHPITIPHDFKMKSAAVTAKKARDWVEKGKGVASVAQECLQAVAFTLFLNSSNVSYEFGDRPKTPTKNRDLSWWMPEFRSDFEVLKVKDIPTRYKFFPGRTADGTSWKKAAWVKGHFKVLSYCPSCGARRGIKRFLRHDVCACKQSLTPENCKTKMFWWSGHWAGPNIADAILSEMKSDKERHG